MKLRRVGFFQELDHGDPTGPRLADLVNDRPQPDEIKISSYLRRGLLLIGCPGVVADALDSTVGVIGSPDILTDGMWAWPGDLPYYVEKYHPALPGEFVSHIRERSFQPPTDGEVDVTDLEL
jgi:hypothetical protein